MFLQTSKKQITSIEYCPTFDLENNFPLNAKAFQPEQFDCKEAAFLQESYEYLKEESKIQLATVVLSSERVVRSQCDH